MSDWLSTAGAWCGSIDRYGIVRVLSELPDSTLLDVVHNDEAAEARPIIVTFFVVELLDAVARRHGRRRRGGAFQSENTAVHGAAPGRSVEIEPGASVLGDGWGRGPVKHWVGTCGGNGVFFSSSAVVVTTAGVDALTVVVWSVE